MSSTTRIGVIGAGWWATTLHLPELKADSRVTIGAISRLGCAELERVKTVFGAEAAYEDYRAMLANESLRGVIICSPHTLHYEHARAALERGCAVLVEKPFTTDAREARSLISLAAEMRAELMVAYGYNFAPMVQRAAQLLADGAIGEVGHVTLHMASSLEDLFSGQGLLEAQDAMFQPSPSTWADPKNAGGYGWGQLTHALGILFYLVNLEPAEVFATTVVSSSGVDVSDAVSVRFKNGATGSMSGTALLPKKAPVQLDIRLYGSKGALLLDMERERLELHRHEQPSVAVALEAGAGRYPRAAPVRAFINLCCGSVAPNPASGMVGQRATEVLDALYRSAASRRPESCVR